MKTKKILALVLALVMIGSVFAACGDNNTTSSTAGTDSTASTSSTESSNTESSSAASEPAATGTGMYPGTPDADAITINISSEPPTLNSLLMTDTIGFQITKHIHENLVMMDEKDNVIPGAAESWDISEDGLTYTFHLREGLTWSNGDALTAKDYEFAFKKLLEPEVAAQYAYFGYIIAGGEAYNAGEGSVDDVAVKAIDDTTLEIVLESPTAYALSSFTFGSFAPINEAFYNEVGADAFGLEAANILSSGAYTVESWSHESEFVITKNDNYWNAANVGIPTIKMVMINDTNAAMNAFKSGEVDMIGLNGDQAQMMKDEGYEVKSYADGSSWYLEFNLEQENLANENIRKAFAFGIDKQAYIDSIVKNSSLAATSFTPPGVAGLNGDFRDEVGELIPVSGDFDKAKEYLDAGLAELGITAEELGASITMISDDGDTAAKTAAFIQEQLRVNLGVEIKTEAMPFKSRLERMDNKDFSIVFAGWGPDYNDPNTFLDLFVSGSGNNHTSYTSEAYDKLVKDAAVELDAAARMEMFYELEKMVCEDLMVAPVYWRQRDYVVSEKVSGEYRTMLQDWNFSQATIVS